MAKATSIDPPENVSEARTVSHPPPPIYFSADVWHQHFHVFSPMWRRARPFLHDEHHPIVVQYFWVRRNVQADGSFSLISLLFVCLFCCCCLRERASSWFSPIETLMSASCREKKHILLGLSRPVVLVVEAFLVRPDQNQLDENRPQNPPDTTPTSTSSYPRGCGWQRMPHSPSDQRTGVIIYMHVTLSERNEP